MPDVYEQRLINDCDVSILYVAAVLSWDQAVCRAAFPASTTKFPPALAGWPGSVTLSRTMNRAFHRVDVTSKLT